MSNYRKLFPVEFQHLSKMNAQNFEETQNTKAVTNPTLSQDSNMENSKPEEVLKKKLAVVLESLETAQKIKLNTLKNLLVESHEIPPRGFSKCSI